MLTHLAESSDEVAAAYQTLQKALDPIMALPFGKGRWTAVRDLLVKTNPIAGEDAKGNDVKFNTINRKCIRDNAIFRDGLINKFGGSSKGSKGIDSGNSLRASLSMPRLLYQAIELVDPLAFKLAKNRKLMFETFPEYTRSEAFSALKD